MKRLFIALACCLGCVALQAQPQLIVKPSEEIRPILMMNGVGAGPEGSAHSYMYKAAGIPFIRIHDISSSVNHHCADLIEIFPNFDADETKPESYDFLMTDAYMKKVMETGAQIVWRLGNSHHEPSQIKKFGAWPPKDFKKWASICSHVVAHYTEGWADGFHYDIKYWEIWNEPDGDQGTLSKSEVILPKDKDKVGVAKRYQVAPHSWGGTMEQYYDLFATTEKLLRKEHPWIKIGGPANASRKYDEPFLQAMAKRGVKLDFFTWHRYSHNPQTLSKEGKMVRELLDKYGYKGILTLLDEWNYVLGWDGDSQKYSEKVRGSIKGAAFVAASMCHMQDAACTDVLNYYDFRKITTYNGAFDRQTGMETATYYVFYDWNKLRQYGTQVAVECDEDDIYAVAARNPEGKVRVMVARFNDDDSVYLTKSIFVPVPEGCTTWRVSLNDTYHMNCEYPFAKLDKGIKVNLEPNSFAFLEFE